jgi:hypothetical protein
MSLVPVTFQNTVITIRLTIILSLEYIFKMGRLS